MREMKDSGVEWLGEVPAEWELPRIGAHFVEVTEKNDDLSSINALRFSAGAIVRKQRSQKMTPDDLKVLSGYTKVIPNDEVINCLNLNFDLKSLRVGIVEESGVITSAYLVIRQDKSYDPSFCNYMLKAFDCRKAFHNMGTGIRKTLNWAELKRYRLPKPPLGEQHRIADFLDEKCNEIDCAVSAAERSIEEYGAYQNDVVKRAIVYGTCNAFKVKESGVPAIGKMNASWSLVMAKRLAVFLNGDRSDSYPSGDDIQETGIPFITSGDLNGRYLPDVFSKYISQDKYDSLKGVKLQRGDVVFCLRGSVGKCSLNRTENRGTVASSLTVARPTCCAPEWLSYALTCSSTTNQAMATAIGATSANLAASVLARAFVPLPPLSEQRRIADYLDEKCTQIDAAIAAKQAIVADLKAYRQSLIFETVTGKREV